MSEKLCETLLKVLAVPEGSLLRRKVVYSAHVLFYGNADKPSDFVDGAANVMVLDLFSKDPEKNNLATKYFAALWISAKFWCASLQRVALVSLLTDIITDVEGENQTDSCDFMFQAIAGIVNQVCKKEVILLRQSNFVVPGAHIGVMTHSTDLQWLLVRQNSKFLQKRNGIRLSSDPFNNNANWTRRHAGFLNTKAAVVKTKGDRILLTTKSGEAGNRPKAMYTKTVMDAGVRASDVSRAVAAVRPDLADVAFRRARKMAVTLSRMKKVQAARKERSAKITFHRKSVRPKRH